MVHIEKRNKILVDKYNKQIIIYYSISTDSYFYYDNIYYIGIYYIGINFYDNDFNLKKIINYEENGERFIKNASMKILNKEYYILFHIKILLISAKYLEIVNVYEMNFNFSSNFVLNNSNRILLLNKEEMRVYKFYQNELKYVGKQIYINNKIIDVIEINEKGEHIIIMNSFLNFNLDILGKEISEIFYIKNINNKNNKKIIKDYSMIIIKKDKYYDDVDYEYYWQEYNRNFYSYDDYGYYLSWFESYCLCWSKFWDDCDYLYKKEDRHRIKKSIKIRKKENL